MRRMIATTLLAVAASLVVLSLVDTSGVRGWAAVPSMLQRQ